MNGTQRYYNDRIREEGGNLLLKYDPITWRVTHRPLTTQLVLFTRRTNTTNIAEGLTFDLAQAISPNTGAFSVSAGVYTCVQRGLYYIRVVFQQNTASQPTWRASANVYVNSDMKAPSRFVIVQQNVSISLMYFFEPGDTFRVIAEDFVGIPIAFAYRGQVIVYSI